MSRCNVNVFQSFTVLLSPGHFPSTGVGFWAVLGRLCSQKCNNQHLGCLFPGHFTASGGGL